MGITGRNRRGDYDWTIVCLNGRFQEQSDKGLKVQDVAVGVGSWSWVEEKAMQMVRQETDLEALTMWHKSLLEQWQYFSMIKRELTKYQFLRKY